jgi:CRISPR-associated protein Cas2
MGAVPSGYQAMWLFAMFDLPVDTKTARRQYAQFRKALIKEGFSMLQYSVYARYCPSEESAAVYKQRLRPVLPPDGQVRLLCITERQFGKMEVYFGKARKPVEDAPTQLLLF